MANELYLGEKAKTFQDFPFILLYFASRSNNDDVKRKLNGQFVTTKRMEDSAGDVHSQAQLSRPSKNNKDVNCRQYYNDRQETNEVLRSSSAKNAPASNEVVSSDILAAENFNCFSPGKRKANVCTNSSNPITPCVPLGDGKNGEIVDGSEQHLQKRRLRSSQPFHSGGENNAEFAMETSHSCVKASQVGSSKVSATNSMLKNLAVAQLIGNNSNATVKNTVEHHSVQTNSCRDRDYKPKPLSQPAGTKPDGTLNAVHQNNAALFWNNWSETFIRNRLGVKRTIHANVPEIGSTVLVVNVLQPPHSWCLTEVTGIIHRNNLRKNSYAHGKTSYVPQTFEKFALSAKNNGEPP